MELTDFKSERLAQQFVDELKAKAVAQAEMEVFQLRAQALMAVQRYERSLEQLDELKADKWEGVSLPESSGDAGFGGARVE